MTTTAIVRRLVVTFAALASIALAGASGVHAADPSLGAAVEGLVYLTDDARLSVWNRSTVEARFDFEASGGYAVEPTSLVLEPDEKGHVVITGEGADGSVVVVLVRSTAPPPPGHSESVVAFEARIFHVRPFDPLSLVLPTLWLVVAVVTAVIVARHLRVVASRYAIVRKEP